VSKGVSTTVWSTLSVSAMQRQYS